ncbi:hypothetical protein IQ03_04705 [Gemmobacter caeni]|uniref:Uncharacterized protein n=2 Tax=Gemmobacter TaxID=204456 RepID=A0A2T6B4A2_9RHOB|nr:MULTISPECIES: hypothetical protein [Gemmobacter]PTX50897.1 hypothetical protein C8N34_10413 [Gemmobacter caeni]TWI93593.1 hypothetical protein IQ03_04705 [Gemmobacter caeni]GHC37530.1 hypothetical protein GCM10007291_43840 [Gemmobacter nanjingensis]
MSDTVKEALTDDHATLSDGLLARRYFAKFDAITGHLGRVAAELEAEGRLGRLEARVIGGYVQRLAATFRALSHKYLMTGRLEGALPGAPTFDRHESGFPIAQELMLMAVDAQHAVQHLAGMAAEAELKDRMVRQIVGDLTVPTQLQFALSQRLYYEALKAGGLFQARNDPDAQWVADVGDRRRFLVHWAVYDTQTNLPAVYLLEVEDTGRRPFPTDDRRWPQAQAHLMAQSLAGLKLVTIAMGFDRDFADLYPRRLRRITLGPMYSHSFTLQSGPIAEVLANAMAPTGEDWALVWTIEDLLSDREEEVKDGWFSTALRQVWRLDPVNGGETGATRLERMMILPERPYQALAELNPPGFANIRKFVVGAGGRLIPAR